jgi:hypothetical protein
MEGSDDLLQRVLAENPTGQPMVVVGLRIGQQVREIFEEKCEDGSLTVHGPLEDVALSLIRGLEMTLSSSQTPGQIVWKPNRQYRVVSIFGDQQAEFEILSSLLNMIDEGKKSGNEESVATQIWELAPDEIYLLTVEE